MAKVWDIPQLVSMEFYNSLIEIQAHRNSWIVFYFTKKMPFDALFTCFKKKATDLAEDYGGSVARDLVEEGFDQVAANQNEAGGNNEGLDMDQLLQKFTGKQQGGLTQLFDTLAGSIG